MLTGVFPFPSKRQETTAFLLYPCGFCNLIINGRPAILLYRKNGVASCWLLPFERESTL